MVTARDDTEPVLDDAAWRTGGSMSWMPREDSNLDWRSQNPLSYH